MKIQPTHDNFLVKVDKKSNMVGSIEIPQTAVKGQAECSTGIVLACGPGRIVSQDASGVRRNELCAGVGDRVVFHEFMESRKLKDGEGNDCIIIDSLAVLATIKE